MRRFRDTQRVLAAAVGVFVLAVTGAGVAVVRLQGDPPAAHAEVRTAALPPERQLTPVPHPAAPRPDYLRDVTDPVFGSVVTRISDQRTFKSTSKALRQSYAKLQPWNSDGSRVLLGYTNPGFLLDGNSYAFTGQTLPYAPVGVWSNVDPDTFYSVSGNRLLQVSAGTGAVRVRHTFSGWTSVSFGDGQGSPSNDDATVVLLATQGTQHAVLSYDLRHDAVLAALRLDTPPDEFAWAAASQSGKHIVVAWHTSGNERGTGVDVYDRHLVFERHLYDHLETGDLGYDTHGAEVLVTFDAVSAKAVSDELLVVAVRLQDGRATTVLRLDWVGTHISCRNLDRPGWCFVSDSAVDAPRARTGGYDEIYAVRLDGSQKVQRFAHAMQSRGVGYDWTTLAVPSRDGTRVLWASDWGWGRNGPAYAYVASFSAPAPR